MLRRRWTVWERITGTAVGADGGVNDYTEMHLVDRFWFKRNAVRARRDLSHHYAGTVEGEGMTRTFVVSKVGMKVRPKAS